MSTIFTYHNLYLAYLECRKHKRKTNNALAFEFELEKNLASLLRELQNGTYQPGHSLYFIVTEPKPREIFAADFRDRVVHHLFVRELSLFADRRFIADSFACRQGRGTHTAVSRLRQFMRNAGSREKKLYFLQIDVKTFFPSIDKNILFGIVEQLIRKVAKSERWTKEMLWLADITISHDPTLSYRYRGDPRLKALVPKEKSLIFQPKNKGLPIGNHTSQFFANMYLNELDHFIKRILKCRRYVRYADDMILLHADPEYLRRWRNEIDQFLVEKLSMRLHPKKTRLQSVGKGIDFLGYFMKLDHVVVRQKVVRRLKNKLRNFLSMPIRTVKSVIACINSYCGHFKYARSFRLRKNIYERYLGEWQSKIDPVGPYMFFRPRP